MSLNLPPCCHISLSNIMGFDIKIITKKFKPHTRMRHIVIIVIIAMLTLCYSMMAHATRILYYHASMLTLQSSLISCALWLPLA